MAESLFRYSALRSQRLVEVANQVVGGFKADREADHIWARARRQALLVAQLAMRRPGGMQDQAAGVADIGEMRKQLHALDQFDPGLVAALDAKRKDGAGTSG